jgi:chitinase
MASTEYTIVVTATNSDGSVNATLTLTTSADGGGGGGGGPPSPPTAINGLASTNITSSTLSISWSGGIGTDAYTTFTLNGGLPISAPNEGEGTYTFSGLMPGTEYTVLVTAENSGGSVNASLVINTPVVSSITIAVTQSGEPPWPSGTGIAILASVTDADSNPMIGEVVIMSGSDSTFSTGTDNLDGTYTISVGSAGAGTVNYSASIGNVVSNTIQLQYYDASGDGTGGN